VIVSGTLTNNGSISTNGGFGPTALGSGNSGGGSGGSIYISTSVITGTGSISADAGTGVVSGGGGRVAVYFNTNTGFNPAYITASGTGGGAQPGSVMFINNTTNSLLIPGGQLVMDQDSTLKFNAISLQNGTSLVMGGGATLTALDTLSLTGNSTIFMHSKNITSPSRVIDSWNGQGATIVARNMTIDVGSSINADGQGYSGTGCIASGDGPGGGPLYCNNSGNGGSYGGRGGGVSQAFMTLYGSAASPVDLGSGGSGGYLTGLGGAGGGVVRLIVEESLAHNGIISANGNNAYLYSGGGSGGSIYITAGMISGSGSVTAKGGASDCAGGGGRIALYFVTNNGFSLAALNADGGSGANNGQPGTVTTSNVPQFKWIKPTGSVFHGVENLAWIADGADFTTTSVKVITSGPLDTTLGFSLSPYGNIDWDTRLVPDGQYEIRLIFSDAQSITLSEVPRSVVINNSALWHTGTVIVSEVWAADKIHVIEGILYIPSGVHITIAPGAVVKGSMGSQIVVGAGGILDAIDPGPTQIVFTSMTDDSVGGDTNLNGTQTKAVPGEWLGIVVQGNGQFNRNNADVRYIISARSGTISTNETWSGSQLIHITDDISVPNGVTLTIQPGTIIKIDRNKGIHVQSGGKLIVNGTVAQPIYFTSIKDDTVGGDTNSDGSATTPAAGDWGYINIGGDGAASFDHASIRYGTGNLGVITSDGALTVSNSMVMDAINDGIWSGNGTATITNSVLTNATRAINGHGGVVNIVNCTIDNNYIGLWGSVTVTNSIVSNSTFAGFNGSGTVRYTDFWNPQASNGNFSGGTDLVGQNGNISADPKYRNRQQFDFRLNYGSPAIDAADGAVAPASDFMGAPRYDDPRTPNTGSITATSAYADMGAYEFAEASVSDLDLVVTRVTGPASALVGSQAQLSWTITNNGTGSVIGPWHDAIYLVRNPDSGHVEIFVGEMLVGQNVILGPGQSFTTTATIRVPGTEIGNHRWKVLTNSRGEVFEGQNSGNNSAVSAGMIAIDLPELVVNGTVLSDQFTAVGQSFWYKMTPGVNKDATVSLNIGGNAGTGELYIGQGYLPDRQHYDSTQQQWHSAEATVLVPSSSQICYVLAYNPMLISASANFTLAAKTAAFSITAVKPGSVTNSGTATFEITGGQLSSGTSFGLVAPNSTVYTPLSVFLVDSSRAYATFNLTELATGSYGMRVTENGTTLTNANAITVTSGNGGQIEYGINVPQAIRAGGKGTVTVTYKNIGSTDAIAPLMWLTTTSATLGQGDSFCANIPGGIPIDPYSYAYYGGCKEIKHQQSFTSGKVLGINHEGPAGILPPGAGGSTTFEFDPTITGGFASLTVSDVTNPETPMDWASLQSSMMPAYDPVDAWNAVFANMKTFMGNTMKQFNAALAADATYLSRFGRYEENVNQLLTLELMKAGLATIIPRYTLGAYGRGASHSFDLWGEVSNGTIILHYPVGKIRQLFPDSTTPGNYIGSVGDSGTISVTIADQSWNLTEKNGTRYQFKVDPNNASHHIIDYLEDLNGNRITANYTANRVTSITSSTGDTQQFSYNNQGRISQMTDAVGRIATYTYDPSGEHLLAVTNVGGTTSFSYVTGQGAASEHAVQSIIYPDGTHRYFEYDTMGHVTKMSRDGGTEAITFAYDPSGTVTITDAMGNSTLMLSDEYGQIGESTDPRGAITRFSYDQWHNLISAVTPNNSTSSFGYDAIGNPVASTDPMGYRQSFGYGTYGKLTSLTDGLNNLRHFTYDSHDNNTAAVYPDGSTVQTAYDARGNLVRWTNRRGRSVNFTYDSHDMLTQKLFADGSQVNYSYDGHRNLQSLTSSSGTISFTYDSADRVTGITYPNGRFINYGYDSSGRRTSMTDQSGFVMKYAYDTVGRLSKLFDGSSTLIASYTYDAVGRMVRKDMGNGTYTTYVYDPAGNLLQLVNYAANNAVNSSFTYNYDLSGRKIGMSTPDGTYSYDYDASGQLISITPPSGGVIQYRYDAVGNRITTIASGVTTSYSSNNLNEYTAVDKTRYSYDTDGNLTGTTSSNGTWSYHYDDENHLVGRTGPGETWTYDYDSLGNRVAQTHNGQRTEYLVDPTGLGNIIAEFDNAGALRTHYTYGFDLTSANPSSGAALYYHFDGSGNTAQMTGAGGSVLNRYSYLPFGEKTTSIETVANPFTFVGQYGVRDEGSSLYFMRNRWYDPALGRFIQPDPLDTGGGDANLYRYVANRPTGMIDPLGLKPDHIDTNLAKASLASTVLSSIYTGVPKAIQRGQNAVVMSIEETHILTNIGAVLSTIGLSLNAAQYAHTATKYNSGQANILEYTHDAGVLGSSSLFLVPLLAETAAGAGLVSIAPVVATVAVVAGVADFVTNKPLTWLYNYLYEREANDPSIWGPRMQKPVLVAGSQDPNLKITVGYGTQGYVTGDTSLVYTIDFENMSSATAPAQKIVVTDQLNSKLDWATLQLISYGFNNTNVAIPEGLQTYTGQTTVPTDPNPVNVTAALNQATGLIIWTMESIDPVTGGVPADPFAGFLPPNDATHRGDGYVTFSVKPKVGLADGTDFTNKAIIVFDVNAPIDTNVVINTIDLTNPTSNVSSLPATSPANFTVNWGGNDAGGSGIASYDVNVSTDGGTYVPWLTGTTATSATYTGSIGHTYSFYSYSTDNVGHRQVQASSAVTTITSNAKAGDCDFNGIVTIAEVQSAINMFLGLKTAESCVNIDNTGGVTIAEVQKVINSFLGL
jgi:RHS repeat-associated protein